MAPTTGWASSRGTSSIVVSSSSDRTATFWPAGRQASGPMSLALTTRREFTRDEVLSVKGELYPRGRRVLEPVRVKVTLRDEVGVAASVERDVAAAAGAAPFAFDVPLRETPWHAGAHRHRGPRGLASDMAGDSRRRALRD